MRRKMLIKFKNIFIKNNIMKHYIYPIKKEQHEETPCRK